MENKAADFVSVTEKKNAEDSPLFSIITPVFNSIKFLEICIQSVLNQTYPRIEHIFVDGGSTDGNLDILASYAAKYPGRIRYISEHDSGAVDATNKGLAMAKGDIFGLLGSDDTLEPGAIQTVMEFFKTNPDAYFVYGDCNIMNSNGEIIGKSLATDFDFNKSVNNMRDWSISGITSFYRRQVIETVGLFDTKLLASDFDYWLRTGEKFRLYRIEKTLANQRVHPGSLTGAKGAYKRTVRDFFIISRRHGGSLFSPCAREYYRSVTIDSLRSVMIESLRPMLGRFYPFMKRLSGKA